MTLLYIWGIVNSHQTRDIKNHMNWSRTVFFCKFISFCQRRAHTPVNILTHYIFVFVSIPCPCILYFVSMFALLRSCYKDWLVDCCWYLWQTLIQMYTVNTAMCHWRSRRKGHVHTDEAMIYLQSLGHFFLTSATPLPYSPSGEGRWYGSEFIWSLYCLSLLTTFYYIQWNDHVLIQPCIRTRVLLLLLLIIKVPL